MGLLRKFTKNTATLFFSRFIGYILAFFYTIFIARYLGASDFGIFSFAISFTGIFGVVSDLGLSVLTTRDLARNIFQKDVYVGNIIIIGILMSILSFLLITVVINLLGYSNDVAIIVYIMALFVIMTTFTRIFYAIFQANERMEYQSIGEILTYSILFLLIMIGISLKFNVFEFSILYLFTSLLVLFYSFLICIWKFFTPTFRTKRSLWVHIIKNALPFGLTSVSGVIYTYIDTVILSILSSSIIVGIYAASYRLTMALFVIPNVMNLVIFPIMSRMYVSDSSKINLKKIVREYFMVLIILGIPIGFGVTILAEKIILLFFGDGYLDSIICLKILIWAIVFIFANSAFVKLLESSNRQLTVTKIVLISMLLNVILNIVLIPKFTYIGASFATVATELSTFIIVFAISCNEVFEGDYKHMVINIFKIIFGSLIMSLFLILFINLNLFILILLSVLLYFFLLYSFNVKRQYVNLVMAYLIGVLNK